MKNIEKYIDEIAHEMSYNDKILCENCKANIICELADGVKPFSQKECEETFKKWAMGEAKTKLIEKYRPFENTNELISEYKKRFNDENKIPNIWVKSNNGNRHLITMMTKRAVILNTTCNSIVKTVLVGMNELFNNYTFIDESPCGYEVEND